MLKEWFNIDKILNKQFYNQKLSVQLDVTQI